MRFAAAALVALVAVACSNGVSAPGESLGGGDGAASGANLTTVTSVFPLAWLVDQIAPTATHTVLGGGGAQEHDLELTPDQRAALSTADLVVYIGDVGFQPQVELAAGDARGEVVAVTEVVEPAAVRAAPGDPDSVDPHLWFDPAVMADVATAIGAALDRVDASAEPAYSVKAAVVAEQLRSLDGELSALLASCAFPQAIVSHMAYAYLLAPRQLEQIGIAGVNPDAGASPGRLAELVDQIQSDGIPAVLAEPIEGRGDAEALAREASVELLEIDPLESASPEAFARGYPAVLREQAEAFATAMSCTGADA